MTATAIPVAPTAAPAAVGTTGAAPALLDLLDDALLLIARDDDLDRFAARTPAGAAVASLAAIARRAATTAGAEPTRALSEGAGVVVVRDLVAATRLLARVHRTDGADDVDLLDAARRVHAALRDLLTTAS